MDDPPVFSRELVVWPSRSQDRGAGGQVLLVPGAQRHPAFRLGRSSLVTLSSSPARTGLRHRGMSAS